MDAVLKQAADQEIRFVQVWFTDLLGNAKSIEIPSFGLPATLPQLTIH